MTEATAPTPVRDPDANRRTRRRARIRAWTVGLAVFFAAPFAFAGPPAGTVIPNFATGTATVAGLPAQFRSDTVIAIVQPLEQITLAPSRSATAPPGSPVGFAHQLVNTGNVTSDVRLDVANLAGDGFDLTSFTLTLDT